MKKRNMILSFLLCIASNTFATTPTLAESKDYIIVKPNENIKSVVSRLGVKKDITYEVEFADFNLKNTKDLKIKDIDELIEYVKNTNNYDIVAENKNKSKYQNKLPTNLTSTNVPKKEIVKPKTEEKVTSIVNFNQLYVFINDGKPNNSTNTSGMVDYGNNVKKDDLSQNTSVLGDEDLSKVNDLNFIKEKIFELAKISNKVDLLFLKERLKEISTLEAVKKLIQELERI